MSQFVDECNLHVKGGDGGAGSVSFRREAHVAMGGPDGGDGGDGGDVWLVADHNVASLLGFRDHPFRRGEDGTHGSGKKRHGKSGADMVVPVPEGTVIKDRDGTVLADMVHTGDRFLAAEGGQRGRGNARFLSNKRRAPGFAEQGEVGEERWLHMELKLLADVALVGFPSVGKSTLISVISAAKPKIADYPFTTLEPNLGVVKMDDEVEFVVADLPGLIEGASDGKGLGDRFLRHVERARVLVVMLDLAPMAMHSPAEQEKILLSELADYDARLLTRPRIVVGSRADLDDGTWEFDGPRVAAVTGNGVPQLVGRMAQAVTDVRAEAPPREAFVVHKLAGEGFQVVRDETGDWVVEGRQAIRAVAFSDLTNPEAMDEAQRRLKSLGIDKALARAGAQPGDTVHIGKLVFDYETD
ncbi:GTPase ObgE [Actinospongicola halichondriae]|uniref:GTPase ObgE n=1 Tax=Actinospongicola halichondriae TaxID=3236844 RepID=UPI003D4DC347